MEEAECPQTHNYSWGPVVCGPTIVGAQKCLGLLNTDGAQECVGLLTTVGAQECVGPLQLGPRSVWAH